uniref:DUF6598 domain-containing protein n=1 Tax=Oryza barthii TaxID=65489 RepID=A0A0D3GUC6_9ORYZ
MKNIDIKGTISEVIDGDEKTDKDVAASEVIYINYDILGQTVKHDGFGDEGQRSKAEEHMGGIVLSDDKEVIDDEEFIVNDVLPESRHHDGSIYRDMDMWWKRDYHIADRNEKLVKLRVDGGLVELYGYIAVRDDLDPLLNYIVNVSRDDPIIVEQGSLINMAGPKRGIDMMDYALIEYDMRIKTGEQEKDDIQLIDGASLIGPAGLWDEPYAIHLPGDYGVVEITLSRLCWAVEATVEVVILEVKSSFDLLLGCLTSGLDKEIHLFDDTITEPCGLKRFPWEPRYMTTINRVKGNESGTPYRRPYISSANVVIPSRNQGMKNIDTKGTISEVIAGDEKIDKDVTVSEVICVNYDISGQIMKHDRCGDECRKSKTKEHMGGIIVSDDKEAIDDEGFVVDNTLPESRHRDGSIYRDMDMWWKKDYHIADRNETTNYQQYKFLKPAGSNRQVITQLSPQAVHIIYIGLLGVKGANQTI